MRILPFLALPLLAQPHDLEARRIREPIRLDGRLEEAAWSGAAPATGFAQFYPDYGQASPQPTEVRVLYDDEALYIGARMRHVLEGKDARRTIKSFVHRRDQDSRSDWFGVYLDTLHDRRTALAFLVNAGGVQRDLLCYSDTAQDDSWDGVWESAVSVDAEGWTAELRIPLSILRINGHGAPQTWGINFMRRDEGPHRHWSLWRVVPRGETAFVSRFPVLGGIQGLSPRRRRDWLPYLSVQRKFETTRGFDDRRWTTRAGLDAHLGLTSHSQVDLTLRPDFGQVEVDQAVLNLSDVETYFPEKRPFFLEGMEIFRVLGPDLFYSRRIGAGLPAYSPAAGERVIESPAASEIQAAGKYTAKYPSGLNVGLLGAQVAAGRAEAVEEASGRLLHPELGPQTAFGVLRMQQQLDEQGSYVGSMHTFVRQASATGREARVNAADVLWKSPDRSFTFDALFARSDAGSRNQGLAPGWFGRARVLKSWKAGITFEALLGNVGRDFTLQDAGYRHRYDERFAFARLDRQWDRSAGPFKNWNLGIYAEAHEDQAGRPFAREAGLRGMVDTRWFFAFWGTLGTTFPAEDDRELRTASDPVKKYLQVGAVPFLHLGFDTPGNRPWYGRFQVRQANREGGPSRSLSVFQQLRPTPSLDIQLDTTFSHEAGERRWIATMGHVPVTGLRRLSLFNQVLRVGYAFTPRLTVQFFGQWLDAQWAFRDPAFYVDDRTQAPGLPGGAAPSMAYGTRSQSLNLIGRWEFRPGSTAFLVYTHGNGTADPANHRGALSPVPDLAALRHLPSDDVVQMKVSWLF